MGSRRFRLIMLSLAGSVPLGGCTTYGAPPPSIAYVPGPCGAPGAVRVLPVAPTPGAVPANPAAPVQAMPAPLAGAANGSSPPTDERCLVAINVDRGGYYRGAYPCRYGYPGYYGSLGSASAAIMREEAISAAGISAQGMVADIVAVDIADAALGAPMSGSAAT